MKGVRVRCTCKCTSYVGPARPRTVFGVRVGHFAKDRNPPSTPLPCRVKCRRGRVHVDETAWPANLVPVLTSV